MLLNINIVKYCQFPLSLNLNILIHKMETYVIFTWFICSRIFKYLKKWHFCPLLLDLLSAAAAAAAAAKSLQSCPTLYDPMDSSPAGSSPGKNIGVGCHFLLQHFLFLPKYITVALFVPNHLWRVEPRALMSPLHPVVRSYAFKQLLLHPYSIC